MLEKTKARHIALAFAVLLLACFAACVLYASLTKSFPVRAVESVLFRDVIYDFNGGTDDDGNSGAKERLWFWEGTAPPGDVARDGYDLVDWDAAPGDDALQARWKLREYAIAYDLDYGELSDEAAAALPASCTIMSDSIALPQPIRYAYSFAGWTLDDGTPVEWLECSAIRQDTTVHANWNRLDFIVPETIYLGEEMAAVPYIYSINSETAPQTTAGVWQGTANVEDGKPTYYIGHNPGVFAPVESFAEGSRFAVCDDSGNLGVYRVERVIVILYEGTIWTEELEKLAMPEGEYASLQTCRGDKVFMDIYVAKRIDG